VTVNVNTVNLRSVDIQSGGTLQGDGTGKVLTYGRGGGEDFRVDGTLHASGANAMTIRLNRSSQWGGSGSVNLSFLDLNTRTLTFTAGTVLNMNFAGAGDPILGTGTITPLSTITFTYNGTSAQLLSALTTVAYANLVIANPAGVTMQQNLTATTMLGDLTITGGGILSTGNGPGLFNITGTAGHTFAMNAGATLIIGNGNVNASSFPTGFGTFTLDQASTVQYSNSSGGTQTVSVAPTYGNLLLSGAGIKSVPAGSLTLLGDWTNNSTGAVNFNASSTVIFGAGASASRTIGGTAGTTFNNLTVDNAAGISLGLTTTVNGALSLGANHVSTGSNILAIGASGSVSRTSGYVNGFLRKTTGTGAPTVNFEIGDAGTYAPVSVAFANVSVSGTLTANTTSGDHPNIGTSLVDGAKDANRYWTLTNGGATFTTYDATLNFAPGDLDGGAATGSFIVGKYTGGTWSIPTVGTRTSTSTQATGMTSFGDFAVGELLTLTITASAGANGTVTPAGATTVSYGGSQSYTIAPATGYHIADVLVDGVSVGAVSSYPFSNVTASHTISASFAIDVFTVTATSGANGSISPSGPTSVDYDGSQTFTIAPNTGYHVADVLVDGVSVGAVSSYPFTNVTANHTIDASFAIDTFSITSSAGANGSISPLGVTGLNYGSSQTYTITPDAGYHVADVLVDGASVGAVTSYPFTSVSANHTIDASFAIDTFAVTASANAGGTIAPAGATHVLYGGSQTYTITTDTGYHLVDVLVDGVSVGAVTSYPFTSVAANHTISATFAIDVFTVTSSAGANGSISPLGATSVDYGASQTFTITPATGYHVADVLVDGASVGAVTSYPFTNVTANHTIDASFAIDAFEITASAGPHGTIAPAGVTGVNYDGAQTYTITPDTGYHVADVLVDGLSVGAVTSYPFSNITANHTIAASFAIDTFTVSASAGANGSIAPAGVTSLTYGASQTYTITPDPSYHVADVLVDGVSVGAVTSYPFTGVAANHTIAATFTIDTYAINAQAVGGGTITPSGTVSVNHGADQAFAIAPETGFFIADVHVDTTSVGAVTNYTFTNVTANHSITATFDTLSYVITASAGANGSVTPSGGTNVHYNGSQSYSITPSAQYHVVDVLVDGVSVGAVTSYSFTNVTANHTISATFAINTYAIDASAGTNGSISPSGTVTVNSGDSQTFTITPNVGFYVSDVHVDSVSVGATETYTFTDVQANHAIHATFDTLAYVITASAGSHGTIAPAGAVGVTYAGTRTFTVTPDTGFAIADVLVDSVSVGAVSHYTFTNVLANHTIHAVFDTLKFVVTASAGPNGSITPSGAVTVNYGTSKSFTIAPASGYFILDVKVDSVSVGAVSGYTFTDVRADHTIQASFVVNSAPTAASLLVPVNGDTLTLATAADTIAFSWSQSHDSNATDTVTYGFHVWGPGVDSTVAGVKDSSLALALPDVQMGMTYHWTVTSTDGIATTASADTFAFVIDFSSGVGNGAGLPTVFMLHQNFPNPFNPTSQIKFDLPSAAVVTLTVYNLLGQEVRTLIQNQEMSAGFQEVKFDGAELPSGVYLYRLTAKGESQNPFVSVKKMVMLK
jgi:hypothetical protein